MQLASLNRYAFLYQKQDVDQHSHVSNLLMNNYPVLQLSHRLGHADPSITLSIYSHIVQGQELDVNNFLPNIGLKQVN